jgi:type III secretion protein I
MDAAAIALVAQLTPPAIPVAEAVGPALPVVAPDGLAAARFRALMEAPPTANLAPVDPSSAAHGPGLAPVDGEVSLGDRVLAGMQNVSGELQQAWKTVSDKVYGGKAMDAPEMLQLQLQLTQIAVQYELLGKAVSRSTQNIDQLVRIQ